MDILAEFNHKNAFILIWIVGMLVIVMTGMATILRWKVGKKFYAVKVVLFAGVMLSFLAVYILDSWMRKPLVIEYAEPIRVEIPMSKIVSCAPGPGLAIRDDCEKPFEGVYNVYLVYGEDGGDGEIKTFLQCQKERGWVLFPLPSGSMYAADVTGDGKKNLIVSRDDLSKRWGFKYLGKTDYIEDDELATETQPTSQANTSQESEEPQYKSQYDRIVYPFVFDLPSAEQLAGEWNNLSFSRYFGGSGRGKSIDGESWSISISGEGDRVILADLFGTGQPVVCKVKREEIRLSLGEAKVTINVNEVDYFIGYDASQKKYRKFSVAIPLPDKELDELTYIDLQGLLESTMP